VKHFAYLFGQSQARYFPFFVDGIDTGQNPIRVEKVNSNQISYSQCPPFDQQTNAPLPISTAGENFIA
jgi:hypothetical protein